MGSRAVCFLNYLVAILQAKRTILENGEEIKYPFKDANNNDVNGPFAANRFRDNKITLIKWSGKPIVLIESPVSNEDGRRIVKLEDEETGISANFEKNTSNP